jgi:hypothetical protein
MMLGRACAGQLAEKNKVMPPSGNAVPSRWLVFAEAARLRWLKATVALAFAVGLGLSSPLWIGPRTYPRVPVLGGLELPGLAEVMLFAALFPLAALTALSARPRTFIAAFLAIIAIFCVFDVTRWQPWVYQYGLILATLGLFSWKEDDPGGQARTLNILRLIIASTYIFSGLQKINSEFVETVFPDLVEPVTNVFPAAAAPLYLLGVLAPFLQVAFGVGLLAQRFRRVSLILAVAMHLFILAMVGPLGANWNAIIWPWTAAMAIFDLLLFATRDTFSLREIVWTKRYPFHAAVLALFGVMPLLSFANLWDSYLSAALYSGNLTDALIYTTDEVREMLPEAIRAHIVKSGANDNELDVQAWATRELNVPAYPETRIHKRIAKSLCDQMGAPAELTLVVREHRLLFGPSELTFRCPEL